MKAFIILSTVFFLSSCANRVKIAEPVYMPGYTYVQVTLDTFHVVAENQRFLNNALKQLGCGVCTIEPVGTYYIVVVPPRPRWN